MFQSKLTASIDRLTETNASLVEQINALRLANSRQREDTEQAKDERNIYANAFGIAVGKLCAHLGYDPDSQQTADLVEEILYQANG